jgi:hypothetical protein
MEPGKVEKQSEAVHKHICFLCHRFYEDGQASKCQYVDDHRWGKCPQCEGAFAVGKLSNSNNRPPSPGSV